MNKLLKGESIYISQDLIIEIQENIQKSKNINDLIKKIYEGNKSKNINEVIN